MTKEKKQFPKIRGITRLNFESASNGWVARYMRDGVPFVASFADSKYGSPEAALEEAKKWHKETIALLPPLNRKEIATLKKSNNKSGHTGVYRTFQRKNGKKYFYWVASWSPEKGKHKHKRFYVKTHGEENAKQMAIKAREKAIANLEKEWPDSFWDFRGNLEQLAEIYFCDIFAFEGKEKYVIHKQKERDRDLRDQKIEQFITIHGELFCEVCNFSFEKEYGEIGKGLIEVHHTLALADMTENHKTKLSELLCICSNCHFVIHTGDHVENLKKLQFINKAKIRNKKS